MLSTGCHKIKPQKLSFETDTHPPQKIVFLLCFQQWRLNKYQAGNTLHSKTLEYMF